VIYLPGALVERQKVECLCARQTDAGALHEPLWDSFLFALISLYVRMCFFFVRAECCCIIDTNLSTVHFCAPNAMGHNEIPVSPYSGCNNFMSTIKHIKKNSYQIDVSFREISSDKNMPLLHEENPTKYQ